MIYYLEQFRDAYWPDGQLAQDWTERTDDQKLETRLKAKEKFLAFTTGQNYLFLSVGWNLIKLGGPAHGIVTAKLCQEVWGSKGLRGSKEIWGREGG